jgi:hypothetical protein
MLFQPATPFVLTFSPQRSGPGGVLSLNWSPLWNRAARTFSLPWKVIVTSTWLLGATSSILAGIMWLDIAG